MTSNMTITIEQYRSRRQRLLADLDEVKADLKELDLEAKVSGFNVAELRKWIDAEHKDKPGKRVTDVVDAVLYGEALGHDLGMVPKSDAQISEKRENNSKDPPHDPETGEVAEPPRPIESLVAKPKAAAIVAPVERVAEPEPPKPHIPSPAERYPSWEHVHQGMIDAIAGIHRVPSGLTDEQAIAWQRGHDEKLAQIRERAA